MLRKKIRKKVRPTNMRISVRKEPTPSMRAVPIILNPVQYVFLEKFC
jgi:hypothetical protein